MATRNGEPPRTRPASRPARPGRAQSSKTKYERRTPGMPSRADSQGLRYTDHRSRGAAAGRRGYAPRSGRASHRRAESIHGQRSARDRSRRRPAPADSPLDEAYGRQTFSRDCCHRLFAIVPSIPSGRVSDHFRNDSRSPARSEGNPQPIRRTSWLPLFGSARMCVYLSDICTQEHA